MKKSKLLNLTEKKVLWKRFSKNMKTTNIICTNCGVNFNIALSYYKYRIKKLQTKFFCSKSCSLDYITLKLPIKSIIEKYNNGDSAREIAQIYNTTYLSIIQRLKKAGIEIRSKAYYSKGERNPMSGKNHSEESKEKIRQHTIEQFSHPENRKKASENQARAIAEGKFSFRSSKLEPKVAKVLDKLCIKYKPSKFFKQKKGYAICLDFYLTDFNVALEVNGTYWHSDPRVYPNGPVSFTQKHNQEKYEKKKEVLSKLKIPLLEIWEKEVEEDTEKYLKGILIPYISLI